MRVYRVDDNTVVVSFSNPMKVISTIPIISSNGYVENIIFKFLPRDFHPESTIIDYYSSITKELGVENAIIFLTATSTENFNHIRVDEVDADVFMTIGLEPAVCIKSKVFKPMTVSTINIAAVVRQPLTHNAMVDLLKTIVEAKSIASSDVMLRCESRSCGTVTDAIAVLKPMEFGEEILFAGMATTVGNAIARAVHKVILSVAMKDRKKIFTHLVGFTEDTFLSMFRKLYKYMPIPNISEEKAVEIVKTILNKVLNDPNIWSFMIAARELELHGSVGSIPNISADEFKKDPPTIIADEIIGMALATYIAGMKGLFSMYWVERLKEEGVLEHGELGVFEDDILSALLGSLYTLLYDYIRSGDVNV